PDFFGGYWAYSYTAEDGNSWLNIDSKIPYADLVPDAQNAIWFSEPVGNAHIVCGTLNPENSLDFEPIFGGKDLSLDEAFLGRGSSNFIIGGKGSFTGDNVVSLTSLGIDLWGIIQGNSFPAQVIRFERGSESL